MLIAYAGVLEIGQNFSPGRHASVFDFAASSCGVIAGAVAFQLAYALFRETPIGREVRRANQPSR
jgi:VanZ family protein